MSIEEKQQWINNESILQEIKCVCNKVLKDPKDIERISIEPYDGTSFAYFCKRDYQKYLEIKELDHTVKTSKIRNLLKKYVRNLSVKKGSGTTTIKITKVDDSKEFSEEEKQFLLKSGIMRDLDTQILFSVFFDETDRVLMRIQYAVENLASKTKKKTQTKKKIDKPTEKKIPTITTRPDPQPTKKEDNVPYYEKYEKELIYNSEEVEVFRNNSKKGIEIYFLNGKPSESVREKLRRRDGGVFNYSSAQGMWYTKEKFIRQIDWDFIKSL